MITNPSHNKKLIQDKDMNQGYSKWITLIQNASEN